MATMTLTSPSPQLLQASSHNLGASIKLHRSTLPIYLHFGSKSASLRPLICFSFSTQSRKIKLKPEFEVGSGLEESITEAVRKILPEPVFAVGSGLQVSIADAGKNSVSIKNVEIIVGSEEEDKMQVRLDVPGKETRLVFEETLRKLARSAPPVPGFRRQKGGKTCKVPKDFLRHILGEDQVTEFVIHEIVRSTLAAYVKKKNLTVKDNKVNITRTPEELKSVFVPGNDFGFNATLELQQSTLDLDMDDDRILDTLKQRGDERGLTRRKWKTFSFNKVPIMYGHMFRPNEFRFGPVGSRTQVLETWTQAQMRPQRVRERVRVQVPWSNAPARRRAGASLVNQTRHPPVGCPQK